MTPPPDAAPDPAHSTTDSTAGSTTFSAAAWTASAVTREAIDTLPFVRGLGDGSLDRDRFVYYLAQDAHYLENYARALATAAVKAETVDDLAFFAGSARDSILVERDLHRRHVGDICRHPASPTCLAYTSYLLGVAHTQGYPELVAALLPCFWIYSDVGTRLLERAGALRGHPYADWIGMYADESFTAATSTARAIADRVAAGAGEPTLRRMHAAFARAATFEWMFWDAAWRRETWPA
ncbi:TenA family protein [Actinopolymorpha sp. B17G11]|uniref:TenA family protein n=1 Tax=Actinopolymorpha sp. B17G11 TaxID=3160861 RepID=UPI0032E3DDB2